MGKYLADLPFKIRVNDIFHVHLIKIISPWMKNLETLILDVLVSISLNVGLEEIIGCLIRFDGISQVILGDLFWLSKE